MAEEKKQEEFGCWICGAPIDKAPEGVEIPELGYKLDDIIYDKKTGISAYLVNITMLFCGKCPGGKAVENQLKKSKIKTGR